VTPAQGGGDSPTLRDYLRVLRRRLLVILLVAGLSQWLALVYGFETAPVYEASSTVLVTRTAPAAALTGVSAGSDRGDPERFIQTQAEIGRTETLAELVLRAERVQGRTARDLLAATEVVVGGAADVLEFRVRDRDASLAARLAGEYAAQFVRYQRQLDRAAVQRALDEIRTRLDELRQAGGAGARSESQVYRDLVAKERELQTLGPLDTGKALVLTAPSAASKVSPRLRRDLVVALALGLLVGVLIAFALEALDRRLDSPAEIVRALGMPLLGRVPRDSGRSAARDPREVAGADGSQAHTFQVLRRNVEAALASRVADTRHSAVVFTSAGRRDGKTATVSRLAVALAVAGRRVILVALDPRSGVDRAFGLHPSPGVAGVARDLVAPLDSLVMVPTGGQDLAVLPLGEPGSWFQEFVARDGLPTMLRDLRSHADVVLVDAPPLRTRSDALDIARHADALVLVVSVDGVRERVLRTVGSLLASRGTVTLGFIGSGGDEFNASMWPDGHVMPLGATNHHAGVAAGSARQTDDRAPHDDPAVTRA
jgi:capsular polysaccharide biosynthesis protein/Mrp family chromosome partitioning ATPase